MPTARELCSQVPAGTVQSAGRGFSFEVTSDKLLPSGEYGFMIGINFADIEPSGEPRPTGEVGPTGPLFDYYYDQYAVASGISIYAEKGVDFSVD